MVVIAAPDADVNWLLSTAVQSGAALVAIIGGLLVSRLVALSGERNALRRQRDDADRLVDLSSRAVDEAKLRVEDFNIHYFLNFARDSIYEMAGDVSRQRLVELIEESRWNVPESRVDELLQRDVMYVRRLFAKVEGWLEGALARTADDDDVVAALASEFERDDVNEALRRMRASEQSGERGLHNSILVNPSALLDPAYSAARTQTRDRRQSELEDAVDRSEGEMARELLRRDLAQAALDASVRPPGVRWTMTSLVYLTFSCLVFPLSLMAAGTVTLPVAVRVVIVLVFCSGLFVFFAELVRLLRDPAQR